MVTIYEVAKKAGVSPKTAARILAGAKGRPHNHSRVIHAAEQLGYVRHQQAATLRSGRSGLLGLIVPDIKNPNYPVFFQYMHDIASTRGYQILLSSTFGKKVEEQQALRMFEISRVEGVILNISEGESDEECDEIISRFLKRGVPVILAGRPARNLRTDEIVIKNRPAVEKATSYLLKTGRRKVVFLSGAPDALATKERLEGYRAALRAQGIALDSALVSYGEFTIESGVSQMARLFELGVKPDAVVAANDLLALGALRACEDAGLSVPRDVALVGFDDIPLAQWISPPLTTLRQPQQDIARDCVNLLLERIASRDFSSPRKLVYEPELIIRGSS